MGRLLLLFIVVPAVELALLIEIGARIGTPATLALIVVTGAIGASMARAQGLSVLRDLQGQLESGQLPAGVLVDGLMVLVAAALLVTPGVLTDVVGFSCLVPGFRSWVKRRLQQSFERAVREKRVHFSVFGSDGAHGPDNPFSGGGVQGPGSPFGSGGSPFGQDEPIDVTDRGEDERSDRDRRTLH